MLRENIGDTKLTEECETALFRILQESLTNVARHAQASEVEVQLRVADGWLSMTISDNGVGFPSQESGKKEKGSFGLIGIGERIHALQGAFSVASEPDRGAVLSVSIPLHLHNRLSEQRDHLQAAA